MLQCKKPKLAIYGTGGSAVDVYDMVTLCPSLRTAWDGIVFIDDFKEAGEFNGCPMMPFNAFCETYDVDSVRILITPGEPKAREMLMNRVCERGYQLATLVHPLALVSPSAHIGVGVLIQENVAVCAGATIEDNVWINGKAIVGHDVTIGKNSVICSFSIVSGHTLVGECCYIGISSAVRDHITIGDHSIISMGAAVMKNVRQKMIVMGNPAREIAENKDETVFR